MKRKTVRNNSGRTIPLHGNGVPVKTITANSTITLGPEYYEHYQYISLERKGKLILIREQDDVVPPKPVVSSPPRKEAASSTHHHRTKKSQAYKQGNVESTSKNAQDADGK